VKSVWAERLANQATLDVGLLDGDSSTASTPDSRVLTPYLLVYLLWIDGVMRVSRCLYRLFVFVVGDGATALIMNKEVGLALLRRLDPDIEVFTVLLLITESHSLLL
jgi:hypothetical protein